MAQTLPTNHNRAPPDTDIADLNDDQQAASKRLWQRVPAHLHKIIFDFEKALWTVSDIDDLGDLLCKYEHRLSHLSTGLGHVTLDPFRIMLKSNARPVKQRPYIHSPASSEGSKRG